MSKQILKVVKAVVCTSLVCAVSLTGIGLPDAAKRELGVSAVAEAATVTTRVPLVTYTRYTGNLTTYTTSSLTKKTGYICANDRCTILRVYSNGAVQVRYPVRRGTRIAYASMSGFFLNTSFSNATRKMGTAKTAYRKSTGNSTIGSVYASDQVTIIGTANGRTQLVYPTSSGYKLGWVAGTYSVASNTSATGAITSAQAKAVMFNAAYYANSYADLKAAFGYNANSLYNHYLTYGIKEGRSASPVFDPIYYLNNNSDLKKAYGSNYTAAYNHWINYGCSEGRNSSRYYHGSYYRSKYSDLQNAFFSGGASATAYYNLANHYLTCGISERRWGNSSGYIPGGMGTQNADSAVNVNESVVSKMVAYELSQLGIGDTKGNNNVKYNTWYWGRTINGSGYAWCMAFQAYCCNQVTGSNNAIPRTASCTNAVNKFKQKGQFQYSRAYGGNYTPKAGDLVFYTSNGGKNSCHVGMIIGSPVNGYLQTVEGNIQCSDRNWKVVKFTNNAKRTVSNSYVWGYATPNY